MFLTQFVDNQQCSSCLTGDVFLAGILLLDRSRLTLRVDTLYQPGPGANGGGAEVLKDLRPGDVKAAAVAAARIDGRFLAQLISAANLLDDELATLVPDAVS